MDTVCYANSTINLAQSLGLIISGGQSVRMRPWSELTERNWENAVQGTEPEKTADNTRRHSWIPRENTSEERLQISVQGRVAVQFLRLTETGNRAWKASGTQGRLFKAGLNYPGLVRNLILDMKAWEADSVLFFLPTIWWLVALKKKRENYPGKCFWQKKKKPELKFNPGLALLNRPSNNWAHNDKL